MGSNTPKTNRIDNLTADQSLIDGFTKNATRLANLTILGATQPTKDIVATLQPRIHSAKAVLTTRATWQVAVQADQAVRDRTKTFVSVVKQALLAAFAGELDTLAEFGLTARAKHVLTPEEKLAAAAKAKATREARHTMGSKQKAKIKGTVPTTAPAIAASPAPTPTPAPPATPPALPVAVVVPPTMQPVPPAAPPAPATPPATSATPQTPTHLA